MENTITFLKNFLLEHPTKNLAFQRNLLKEYFQIIILDFFFSHPEYSNLVFYGGTCLRHCYGLPRFSEDLDFVDLKKNIVLENLAKDLESFLKKQFNIPVKTQVQKFRVYVKFGILHELGLASLSESDFLFIKVEIFKGFDFCSEYHIEVVPFFLFGKSILVRTFDLPTLMATKIRAVLYRKWEKIDKEGNILITAKGRDYFDLMWYLEKNVRPNFSCLKNDVKNSEELKEKLLTIVKNVHPRSLELDLEAFIEDENFVKNVSKNMKDILLREIEMKL